MIFILLFIFVICINLMKNRLNYFCFIAVDLLDEFLN